jgi:hypothetical protein
VIRTLLAFCFAAVLSAGIAVAQPAEPLRPEWCRQLPRPEYAKLERILSDEPWFEIYRIRPGVFAIYEPKQFEEVISYLILGEKRALLFDTGLGIGKISTVVARLTPLPVTVLNSHTHFDHVGGNAEFQEIWNRDLPYTLQNMHGQNNAYSRDTLLPERLCGPLPAGTKPESYATHPWKSVHTLQDGERINLGGRELEVLFTGLPDPSRSQERAAVYGRQLLSRPNLPFHPGDRLCRLRAIRRQAGGPGTPNPATSARPQRASSPASVSASPRRRCPASTER